MNISISLRNSILALILATLITLPSSLPAQMVSFFPVETQTCPSGWSVFEPARGYIIRGTDVNHVLGTQVGAPIEDGEPAKHQHGYHAEISLGYAAYAIRKGSDKRARSDDIRVTGTTTEASSDLPFIQYMICQESPENDHSDYLPENSVQWFNNESCPDGWEVYTPATEGRGYTVLPLPADAQASDNGAVVANTNDLSHSHKIKITAPDKDQSNKHLLRVHMDKLVTKWDLFSFDFSRRYFAVDVLSTEDQTSMAVRTGRKFTTASRAVDAGTGLSDKEPAKVAPTNPENAISPFIYLRPCIKKSDTINIRRLPSGIGTFTTGFDCPTGLTRVSSAPGRYLVGLPPHRSKNPLPESGKVFGGKALKSKQRITHHHGINTPLNVKVETVDTSGIFRTGHVNAFSLNNPQLSGHTLEEDMTFSYVQLRFCFKSD